MNPDFYGITEKLDEEFNFLGPKDNFLVIGCKFLGAIKYASEVVNEGLILGLDMEENIGEGVREFSQKHENIKIVAGNPLREETYKKAKFRVQSILNTLDTEPMKSIQAMENSLRVLVPGGVISTVYSQKNRKLVESFLSGLPLERTKFLNIKNRLVSISRRSKRDIF